MDEENKEAKKKKKNGKSPIGLRRMVLQMWCVLSITAIEYMHMINDNESSYVTMIAMMLIASLGGIDAWKQGLFDKSNITSS